MSAGIALKNAGMQQAFDFAGHEFKEGLPVALRMFCSQRKGELVAIEDFREWALNNSLLSPPASPNAWGSVPRTTQKLGLLKPTGQYRRAISAATRAHPVALWRVL